MTPANNDDVGDENDDSNNQNANQGKDDEIQPITTYYDDVISVMLYTAHTYTVCVIWDFYDIFASPFVSVSPSLFAVVGHMCNVCACDTFIFRWKS